MEGLAVLVTGLVVGPLLLGLDDGDAVGEAEGDMLVGEKLLDGLALGLFEGREDSFFFGDLVGVSDGSKLGTSVGSMEGGTVGSLLGFMVGVAFAGDGARVVNLTVGPGDGHELTPLRSLDMVEITMVGIVDILVGVNVLKSKDGFTLGVEVNGSLEDGLVLGLFEGREDGFFVGVEEDTDGSKLGTSVGSMEDGALVGFIVGISICAFLFVGRLVVFTVGHFDCPAEGEQELTTLGNTVANLVGM